MFAKKKRDLVQIWNLKLFLSLRSLLEASKFTCLKQVQTKRLWDRNVVKGSVYNAQ